LLKVLAPEVSTSLRLRPRRYYKKYDVKTIVMAASFRNIGEVRELAGCDNITISVPLLRELAESSDPLPRKLSPESAADCCDEVRERAGGERAQRAPSNLPVQEQPLALTTPPTP